VQSANKTGGGQQYGNNRGEQPPDHADEHDHREKTKEEPHERVVLRHAPQRRPPERF